MGLNRRYSEFHNWTHVFQHTSPYPLLWSAEHQARSAALCQAAKDGCRMEINCPLLFESKVHSSGCSQRQTDLRDYQDCCNNNKYNQFSVLPPIYVWMNLTLIITLASDSDCNFLELHWTQVLFVCMFVCLNGVQRHVNTAQFTDVETVFSLLM